MIKLVDVSKIYRDKKNEKIALNKINITPCPTMEWFSLSADRGVGKALF